MFVILPDLLNPAHRQPFTVSAVWPLFLSYYALGVLTILPRTFILRSSLLPFYPVASLEGFCNTMIPFGWHNSSDLETLNGSISASMFFMTMRSFEWTFIKKPLRKYEILKDQDTPVERPLTISNVLTDGFDLFWNQRGIGWSWSSKPFPGRDTPPLSIGSVLAKMLLKFTVLDASQYLILCVCPSINNPGSGSLFNASLSLWRRVAAAAFCGVCGGLWVWAIADSSYHAGTLIGRILLCQPASQWPPNSRQPWLSTSVREFWSFRWHQALRHFFISFGARPCGKLLWRPGAIMGSFAVSAIFHHIALWGLDYGTEFSTAGGFFLLMGLGTIMEVEFTRVTGLRVQGLFGWLWTMLWTLFWGTFMIDEWARRGMFSNDFFPEYLRLGKLLVDTVITLSSMLTGPSN
ncbi:hypothetical protein B0F90DRAFT_1938763 [Multifurca ochricompacta]|uniref:Wax synthase domain-containing protein n=1 Tax=Multifurca ochricompacta TaxID=376703 RepID=A0AAD4M0B1_9AGAM|nr:hypothetical protein B0F90DRAFT_1938763 [Multifurca ochricompacta]